VITNQCFLHCS